MSNAIVNTETPLMSFIERASRDENFDIAKFEALLRLQRKMEGERAQREFNASMAEAQSEMLPVVKDAKNSHLGNRYAKLAAIDGAIRPVITQHGFSIRYGSAPPKAEGSIRITCTVAHRAGYSEQSYLEAPLGNPGSQGGRTATTPVQAIGSVITYLRRYLVGMAFNVILSDDDDDGEATRRPPAPVFNRPPPQDSLATSRVESPPSVVPYNPAEGRPVIAPRPPPSAPVRTDLQWTAWVARLREAASACTDRQAVVDLGDRDTVVEALDNAPQWVKNDIVDMLGEAFGRFPTEPGADTIADLEAEAEGDGWPGPKP